MVNWRHEIRQRLANARLESTRENEIVEELAQHFESLHKELLADGATAEYATRVLMEELSESDLLAKELQRIERPAPPEVVRSANTGRDHLSNLFQDLRYGLRLFRKSPGFTATVVLTLALGIGSTTAIFSIFYATLIEPMPFPRPDQLVMVWSKIGDGRNVISAGDFMEWRQRSTSFRGMHAWVGRTFNLATEDRPQQVQGSASTPGFLSMVGMKLAMGRDFLPEEGEVGHDHVVILSNRLWRESFGADPDIIGKTLRMSGEPYTVVGVLAPGQPDRHPSRLSVPLAFKPEQINHDFHWLLAMGRLKDGVSREQAQAEMEGIAAQLAGEHPDTNANWGISVEQLQNDFLPDSTRRNLWLLLAVVGCLLLIACVNIANLLLARGASRRKEIAIRAGLGASRARIFGQLLIESALLSLAGGALGVAVGRVLIGVIAAIMPPMLPSEADIRISVPVLIFALLATTAAGLLFGSIPAWQVTRIDLNGVLKEGGRSGGGVARRGVRRGLVIAEFALALTLLAAGGLTLRSFWNLTRVDLGIRPDHVLTFTLPVPQGRVTGAKEVSSYYRQLLERIGAVSGVEHVAASTGLPTQGTGFGMGFTIVGQPEPPPNENPGCGFQMVTPDYFQTFGISVLRGRSFSEQDGPNTPRVAMINENLANRYFSNVDPLTQRIKIAELNPGSPKTGRRVEWQIIGVFHNVRNGNALREDNPEVYVPFWQSPWPQADIAARTYGEPSAVTRNIAAAVNSVDPDLPLAGVKTMDEQISEVLAIDRFGTLVFSSFALLALLLAAIGIYGVMAYGVAQRTHEFGVRLALGAERLQVLGLVLREGTLIAMAGMLIGLAGAYFVGRALQSTLYEVTAFDVGGLCAVGGVLVLTALLASLVPARRASRVDPIVALRYE
jgi:putative ABC transport system permease protein